MPSLKSIFAFLFPAPKKSHIFIDARSFDPCQRRPGEVVILLARNEAGCIASRVAEALHTARQVIVIDQGSTDDTACFAAEAGAIVVLQADNQPAQDARMQEALNLAVHTARTALPADQPR